METGQIIAFNIAILGALASPGPAFIAMIRSSFIGGRRAGLLTGLGLGVAAVMWSALALLGLNMIFAAVPSAYIILKVIGALYLLWLAVALWRNARQPIDAVVPGLSKGFLLGLVTNMANPKLVFFIAAIFSTLLPTDLSSTAKVQLLANHFVLEMIWYAMAAFVLTTAPIRAGYIRAKAGFDRCAALILGALAARIVF